MSGVLDHAFFYNSENHDRVYDASSFEYLLKKFFTSGVFTGDCQVTADGEGMTVTLGGGYSNCDGKVRFFAQAQNLALANAHATYDRIDTVVIERNDTDRDITAKVVTGVYSAEPTPTPPVRGNGIFQLVCAEIYVAAGAVRITQSDITDKRPDTSVCGYVVAAVQTPDFTELYAQFSAEFQELYEEAGADFAAWAAQQRAAFDVWFEHMKDQLDTDAAGHLQNEIDQVNENVAAAETNPSTSAHVPGDVIMLSGILYTVTDDVAAGDRFVVGTNIELTNIGQELSKQSQQIGTLVTAEAKTFKDGYEVTLPNVSDTNRTFAVAGITANHSLVQEGYAYLSNPSAATGDLQLVTAAGTVTVSGTLTGTTNIIASLVIKQQSATGTAAS